MNLTRNWHIHLFRLFYISLIFYCTKHFGDFECLKSVKIYCQYAFYAVEIMKVIRTQTYRPDIKYGCNSCCWTNPSISVLYNRYGPTTPLVFSAWECSLLFGTWGWLTWRVSCGDVRLRLGRRWTLHKKRLTSNITARLLRRRHFSASYQRETEIPDVCCCSRYSGTKAHTARQVSRAQWNGNQPTTYGKPSLCEWSQQRWIMVQFSLFRTTAPPETFISAPSTNTKQQPRVT